MNAPHPHHPNRYLRTQRGVDGVIASLRDQRLDVHIGAITRADFDDRIALTEAQGVTVPDDVKAPIAVAR